MCGISGILSSHEIELYDIKNINDALVHRGPDGSGLMMSSGQKRNGNWDGLIEFSPDLDCFVALGHRRLSIVELSDLGHQPMVYRDRYIITFNGEIYNYIELRDELKTLGYDFVSNSDTEVILAAYDAWGTSCLNKFNGMWAFCIIDTSMQKIFISRDRFGIKPLYYYKLNGLFVFASEVKAILAHPDVRKVPDKLFVEDYLKNGPKVNDLNTGFLNISRIPAASYVECTLIELLHDPIVSKVYWDVEPNLSNEAFDEHVANNLAEKYYALLKDAVNLRLRADVKVGSALSGGLDSSSIVYLVNALLKEKGREDLQETFSCVYHSPGTEHCDESVYINKISQVLGVNSNQIEPNADDIPAEYEKVIYAMDHPPESTCMSGWHTFKLVAESDVTVTLDGQGADEQLAGYMPHWAYWYAQMPLIRALVSWPRLLGVPGAASMAIRGILVNLSGHLIGKKTTRYLVGKLGYHMDPFLPLNAILDYERRHSLMTLIHYADRTSMAWSIESRMPFMDYRLVEFLAKVPAAYKLHNGWTKYLARLAFANKLPSEIVWRKDKMGWPVPESHWFNGIHKDWMLQKLSNPLFWKWFDKDGNKNKKNLMVNGINNLAQNIRVMNVSTWYCRFFNSK